ncbi:hypothetical protein NA63_0079 [Flavobacteriaceae bacterium MAR_2010_105]|nr:hypothetical protein NA63_0079 [Flavobacteriaceae bacterium MAR_2010_105]
MKTKLNLLFVLPFFALTMFTSCQDEVIEITEPDAQETFVAESNVANLMARTSTNDGSYDNIIDGSQEFSVNLPITVIVNGMELTINSEDDFERIEEIFDEYEDDEDSLEIVFPITVTLRDYTEVVVNSRSELDALRHSTPNEEDDDIECIDFKYPLTISVYNANFQVIDVVTIENDRALFRFIRNLPGGVLASLNFPVTMIYHDGSTVEVHNNQELEAVITAAKDECDEDDDNDYNDDDFTKERLDNLLTSCPWIVHDIRRNNTDLAHDYREYLMVFREDGVVKVRARNGDMLTGTWSTRVTNHGAKITLDFDTLVDFTLEWFVYEIRPGKIKLFTEGGNRIILEKTCDTVVDQTIERIENILKECLWRVHRLHVNGSDNEAQYIGTPLKFFADGVVKIRIDGEFVSGTWDVLAYNAGFVLQINLEGRPDLQLEWLITFLEPNLIKLESQNSIMVLKQHCPDGDDDVDFIRDVLNDGLWKVAMYQDAANPQNQDYSIYRFDFLENGGIKVLNPNNVIVDFGSWLPYRYEGLNLGLNFGSESTFNEFNHRWKIKDISETRIELKDYSANGTVERILVFERL